MNNIILKDLLYCLQYKDYTTLSLHEGSFYLFQCSVSTILDFLNCPYLDYKVISFCISDYYLEVWCEKNE